MNKSLSSIAAFLLATTASVCTAGIASAEDTHCHRFTNITGCSWRTPGTYEWTVPDGVTQLQVDIQGGQGGGDFGGGGGLTDATLTVTPGEKLQLNVGGKGKWGGQGPSGGYNGGAEASDYMWTRGIGGGGGTDIRSESKGSPDRYPLANRFIVVGGGGASNNNRSCRDGSGKNATECPGGGGGGVNQNGGGGQGGSPGHHYDFGFYTKAGGGTAQMGGKGAEQTYGITADGGTAGQGGQGKSYLNNAFQAFTGNGGGGGWYGGGGALFSYSAAGGSGYGSPDRVTNVNALTGVKGDNDGDGRISFSFTNPTQPYRATNHATIDRLEP